jgi:nucleoside 2-deoxyribosyltransferase
MIITICGSMAFYKEMNAAKKQLEEMGHTVLVPVECDRDEMPMEARPEVPDETKISAKIEYNFIREHFKKIEQSDAILVLNYDKNTIPGYIGGNTFLEMGIAFWHGKKIYLLHSVPKMNYSIEMHSMQPVVLHGDLTKLQ